MPYVCLPPTVSKVQAANRLQRNYLQQCQTTLVNYSQWCPQLANQIQLLQNVIRELLSSLEQQDVLIQQRIQLQIALESTGLVSTAGLVNIVPESPPIPEYICLPSLEINKNYQYPPSSVTIQEPSYPVLEPRAVSHPAKRDHNSFARPRNGAVVSSSRDSTPSGSAQWFLISFRTAFLSLVAQRYTTQVLGGEFQRIWELSHQFSNNS